MSDFMNSEEETRELQPRFKLIYTALTVVMLIILSRLWFLQILEGQELRQYSEKNRVKETKLPAPRGLILDRESRILVDNISGFDVTISPQYVEDLEKTAKTISPIIDIPSDEIAAMVTKSRRYNGPFRPATIKENLSMDQVYRLERLRIDHPGLDVSKRILRYYPLAENGAQLLGYVGEVSKRQLENLKEEYKSDYNIEQGDIIGKSGLEEVWDLTLRGRNGLNFIEVDAHGRGSTSTEKTFTELKPIPEIPGNNLVLTIDKDIQEAAYKAMLEQDDRIGPRVGSVVAMKSNGEILAWVITPSFNPNKFARGISSKVWKQLINDPNNPLINKVIQDHYAPGSTIKPIIALAALQEGIVSRGTLVNAPGFIRYGRRSYHDSHRGGHGNINVIRAIEASSNTFFYKMGIQLGINTMAKYAHLLGLGKKTGINLKNEEPGNFPTEEWKLKRVGEPWQPGENLSNAIGQGFVLSTMLQMAVAYNTIGLEGKVYQPFLVDKITDQDGRIIKDFEPELIRDITLESESDSVPTVNKEHIQTVKEGLRRVANGDHGTAKWWKIPGVEMAGKTGTIQVRSFAADDIYTKCQSRPVEQRHHGAYIGYAPAEMPDITVAVLTERSCAGNIGSVPVFRDIVKAYMEKYHPEKLKKKSKKAMANAG